MGAIGLFIQLLILNWKIIAESSEEGATSVHYKKGNLKAVLSVFLSETKDHLLKTGIS